MKLLVRLTLAAFALLAGLLAGAAWAGIRDTVHNLSAAGPGAIRATSESRICVFCHTPHQASQGGGVLWNRNDPTSTYVPYDSATLRATVGQPTGASKLCLSCHDGTIALGEVLSEPVEIGFVGGIRFLPVGSSQLGTDLRDDHPISFEYDTILAANNPDLVDPSLLTGAVRLDPFGQLQCTSCHDPHEAGFGKFLVAPTQGSLLCLVCHDPPNWASSSHATSTATWSNVTPDPWPHTDFTTVQDNACENCHRPHSAGSSQWVLNYGAEEDNCLACHNSNVAATDIQSQITMPFHHPVELTTDEHTPNEDATVPMIEHVECSDCHDPHSATDTPATAPVANGTLRGASGIAQDGQSVEDISYEYELCYKCHGEFSMSDAVITRQYTRTDKRLQFDSANPSYHPIVSIGKNTSVPSLLSPLTTNSRIYCTDCHAASDGPGAGGTGPAGPHGSSYEHILERQYNTLDGVNYSQNLYDLCFKCHSATSILNDESFGEHDEHIRGEDVGCGVCHDPHGVSSLDGNSTNNSHLINFDTSVVTPFGGVLEFRDNGTFKGSCVLVCHGEEHDLRNDGTPKFDY